jgi:hypothetical protein
MIRTRIALGGVTLIGVAAVGVVLGRTGWSFSVIVLVGVGFLALVVVLAVAALVSWRTALGFGSRLEKEAQPGEYARAAH